MENGLNKNKNNSTGHSRRRGFVIRKSSFDYLSTKNNDNKNENNNDEYQRENNDDIEQKYSDLDDIPQQKLNNQDQQLQKQPQPQPQQQQQQQAVHEKQEQKIKKKKGNNKNYNRLDVETTGHDEEAKRIESELQQEKTFNTEGKTQVGSVKYSLNNSKNERNVKEKEKGKEKEKELDDYEQYYDAKSTEKKPKKSKKKRKKSSGEKSKRKSSGSKKYVAVKGILKTNAKSKQSHHGKRRVRFMKKAIVHQFPSKVANSARRARKGTWEPAPEDDEIWDSVTQDFRDRPLSTHELNNLLRQRELQQIHFQDHHFENVYYNNLYYNDDTYGQQNHSQQQHYDYNQRTPSDNAVDIEMNELDAYMEELELLNSTSGNRYDQNANIKYDTSGTMGTNAITDSSGANFLQNNSKNYSGFNSSCCYQCRTPEEWRIADVAQWFIDYFHGGEGFAKKFRSASISGYKLAQLNQQDLRTIGVKKSNNRQQILQAISDVFQGRFTFASSNCRCN